MSSVASFHLASYSGAAARDAFAAMAFDRPVLKRTDGLAFFRQLGTGKGQKMTLSADLRRWALFAVWEDEDALDAFMGASPIAERWRDAADEAYTVRLHPSRAAGKWDGAQPLTVTPPPADGAPVAILTRAKVRVRRARAFYGAIAEPAADLRRRPGLLDAVAIGEHPVLRQATFSMWRDLDSARAYAYGRPEHRAVVGRTRAEDWYAEQLFARFHPYAAEGTWDGRDPLTS